MKRKCSWTLADAQTHTHTHTHTHSDTLTHTHTHTVTHSHTHTHTHLSNDECYTDSSDNEQLVPDKDGDLLLTAYLVDVIDAGAGRGGVATGLRECEDVGIVGV